MWSQTRKPQQPVVAARHLLSSVFSWLVILSFSPFSWAETDLNIAILHAHTPEELSGILDEAESWANQRDNYPEQPIAIILHGDEAKPFIKQNYKMYSKLVDKAAKLDAFNVVDIKICETWMGFNGVKRDQLPPFIDTVPFGPAEESKLLDAGYQSF